MGVLAGRPFEPAKRSSIHGRHRELGAHGRCGPATGAAPTTTATRRARRSRCTSRAGLIDVSTLGKLLVRGPGGRRVPRPAVPEPLLEPQAGAHPLRRDGLATRGGSSTTARSAASTTTASTSPRPRAAPARSRSGSPGGSPTGTWTSTSPTSRRRSAPSTSPGRGRARSWPALTDLDCSNEAFTVPRRASAARSRACRA